MKVSVQRAALTALLDRAKGLVSSRSTIPILENALVSAADGTLTISTTNMSAMYCGRTDATVSASGSTTISAKRLADMVRRFDADTVELTQDATGAPVIVRCGHARYSIPSVPPEGFPHMAAPEQEAARVIIWPDALVTLLGSVSHAIGDDPSRVYLQGIGIYAHGDTLRAAASDGHRAAIHTAPSEHAELIGDLPRFMLPREMVGEVESFAKAGEDKVTMVVGEDRVLFERSRETLMTMLVDAVHPDCERVIPRSRDIAVSVDRPPLVAALGRMLAMLDGKSKAIDIRVDAEVGTMSLSGIAMERGGDGEEIVPVVVTGGGCAVKVNARYLSDVVHAAPGDKLVIGFGGTVDPPKITAAGHDEWEAVIMPMGM